MQQSSHKIRLHEFCNAQREEQHSGESRSTQFLVHATQNGTKRTCIADGCHLLYLWTNDLKPVAVCVLTQTFIPVYSNEHCLAHDTCYYAVKSLDPSQRDASDGTPS